MKLQDLLSCLSKQTNVALIDEFNYICTAPVTSPVWGPYLDRIVVKIDIYTPVDYENDPMAAHIAVSLDIDISEDDGMHKESEE